MAIFLTGGSRVMIQGITGSEGRKHGRRMLAAGTTVVGGTNPRKAGQTVDLGGAEVPQEAVAATKRLLWEGAGCPVVARLAVESATITRVAASPDVREGLASVLERREPRFAGSSPEPTSGS